MTQNKKPRRTIQDCYNKSEECCSKMDQVTSVFLNFLGPSQSAVEEIRRSRHNRYISLAIVGAVSIIMLIGFLVSIYRMETIIDKFIQKQEIIILKTEK